jgi:hypothetical protein
MFIDLITQESNLQLSETFWHNSKKTNRNKNMKSISLESKKIANLNCLVKTK